LIDLVDPRAEPGTAAEPYDRALDSTVARPVVGVFVNRFPGSEAFGACLGTSIAALLPSAEVRQFAKADASQVASAQVLDTIAAECHAVITLYGH
jgi:hypothetical protein